MMAAERQSILTHNTPREEIRDGGSDSDATLPSASNIKIVYGPSKNYTRPITTPKGSDTRNAEIARQVLAQKAVRYPITEAAFCTAWRFDSPKTPP